LAAVALVGSYSLHETTLSFEGAASGYIREVLPMSRLHGEVIALESVAYEYVVYRSPQSKQTYEQSFAKVAKTLDEFEIGDFIEPHEAAVLRVATEQLATGRTIVDAVAANPGPPDLVAGPMMEFGTLVHQAAGNILKAEKMGEAEGVQMLSDARSLERRTMALIALTCLLGAFVAYRAARRLSRAILGPIERLHLGARRLEGGDHDVRVQLDRGDELGALGDAFDTMATRLAASQRELVHQAFHDPLTGLANRALLLDRTEHALDRLGRTGAEVALLILDLDEFKTVNDSLGHPAGDELLRLTAARISAELRAGDTVARLGGDEFGILLEDIADRGDAEATAVRINQTLRQPAPIDGRELSLKASIGVAMGQVGDSADEIVRNADLAMYEAKEAGKDRAAVYEPRMHDAMVERLVLESEFRRAIERDEFVVHYQPTVNLNQTSIAGVEALVRWNHPIRGLLAPAQFIGLAEETGLIVPLGLWVLETACKQGAAWREQFPELRDCTMSVNLSARQLQEPDLCDGVAAALTQSGLPAHALVLEVTETFMMQDADLARERMGALRDLGVQLAVDDFGTGYSSLGYLQQFPVDVLKIDKSFVDHVADGDDESAMLEAIIGLARALRMVTVAEGIEEDAQREAMAALGCVLGQGFLFAKPMPVAILEARLRAGTLLDTVPLPAA
jgi:diguanylate cyclase (GGDEF)-like protein